MPAGKKAAIVVLAGREISPNTQGNSTHVGTTRVLELAVLKRIRLGKLLARYLAGQNGIAQRSGSSDGAQPACHIGKR